MNKEKLEQSIRIGIPISEAMDFRVKALDSLSIQVSGGAQENVNVHQTAFAGSLYCICTLAAWGLTHSKLPDNCALVMAKAEIEYLRPVQGEIVAKATLAPQQCEDFLGCLEQQGKARLDLPVHITSKGKTAVKFMAHLHVKKA